MRISECETGDGESLPKPLPRRPKARTTSPSGVKMTMQCLAQSETMTLPAPSTATPHVHCSTSAAARPKARSQTLKNGRCQEQVRLHGPNDRGPESPSVFASFASLPNGVDDLNLCLLLYFPCTWLPTGAEMMTPTWVLTSEWSKLLFQPAQNDFYLVKVQFAQATNIPPLC